MMFAVVLPHLWQIRNTTAMNIMRLDSIHPTASALLKYLPVTVVMALTIFWQAHDLKLAIATVLGLLVLCLLVLMVAWLFVNAGTAFIAQVSNNAFWHSVKLGFDGIKRRLSLSMMQMIGFSVGLTVLMVLGLVRGELIDSWQASLPNDAPNSRALINAQWR